MNGVIGQLLQPFFDAAKSLLADPVTQLVLWILGAYLVLVWLAGAWWTFRDAEQRSHNLVMPYVASALVILATPVLFLPMLLLYRIVRPPETLALVEERRAARQALRDELVEREYCGECGRRVDPAWIRCPICRHRLRRVCPNCHRLVGPDWSLCAWCGRDFVSASTPVRGESRLTTPSRDFRGSSTDD